MNTQSPRFTLNDEDVSTIVSIIIHGLVGTVLTLISMVFLHINYGFLTPLVTTALTYASAVLTKWVQGPTSSTLLIQQLQGQLQALQGPTTPPNAPDSTSTTPPVDQQ